MTKKKGKELIIGQMAQSLQEVLKQIKDLDMADMNIQMAAFLRFDSFSH